MAISEKSFKVSKRKWKFITPFPLDDLRGWACYNPPSRLGKKYGIVAINNLPQFLNPFHYYEEILPHNLKRVNKEF